MAALPEAEGGLLTAGSVGESQGVNSATDLQYQRLSQGLNATGAALGIGRRIAPDPDVLFSHSMSGAQFGGARNSRTTMAEQNASTEEDA